MNLILGKKRCGKTTTLLKLIGELKKNQKAVIVTFNGEEVRRLNRELRLLGYDNIKVIVPESWNTFSQGNRPIEVFIDNADSVR